jgi:sugar/nucleoside kinase (ribokinase family)
MDPARLLLAGGACQNAMRACVWLSGARGSAAIVGVVGADENAERLQRAAEQDGLRVLYQRCRQPRPTSQCAVLVGARPFSVKMVS